MTTFDPDDLEIMRVLWEGGELKPAEIQERLSFPIKNSALRWRLGELLVRGHVSRKRVGKAYVYAAAVRKRSALRKMVHRMASAFCGGSSLALIGQLIELECDMTAEDVKELQRIVAARREASAKSGRKRG